MIGKIEVRSCSNRIHQATRDMLAKYPMNELSDYAKYLGIPVPKSKEELIDRLVQSGKATICGSLGS